MTMQAPQVVPCGSFDLHSRVVRLHTGSSYRDVTIHEMTESEIKSLQFQRKTAYPIGFVLGMFLSWIVFVGTLAITCGK